MPISMPTKSSNPSQQITALSAVQLSEAIHTRDVSCVEVLEAYLAHISEFNPRVNALVAAASEEQLREHALGLDSELAAGNSRGPIHGFPQAPKDIMPVAGMVTTKGSPLFAGQVPTSDAVVFERMRKGGALFIARSNSPEFGLGGHTYNPIYGTTRNAYEPSCSAGGSSGGAAVAVALNMLPVADGSDMMGSLRTPAAFNNVYGFRPTFGLLPHGPTEEVFFQQFSVAGAMGRTVEDLALLLSVQAGFDERLPLGRQGIELGRIDKQLDVSVRGKKVGWLGDLGGHLPTEPGVLETCESALKHFDTIGVTVDRVVPDFDFNQLWQAWLDLRCFSVAGANAALYADPERRKLLKPEAQWEIQRGLAMSAMQLYEAAKVRSAWYQTLRELFKRVDFLVMPAAQVFPFNAELDWPKSIAGRTMHTYHQWMETVVPATMAALPSLAVPAGFGPTALPTGLQIMGRTQADLDVLRIGNAYDKASQFSYRSKPLPTPLNSQPVVR